MIGLSPQEQVRELRKGVDDLISEQDLLKKIEKSVAKGVPLRVKAGFDPSRPDLHVGHTIILNKMRLFQKFGHHVIFLIGDFTALIGDPTGKNETRPALTPEEVQANAQTYARQVFKVLDEKRTEVAYNSHWLGKMSSYDMVRLAAQYTVARMLERDDFKKRYESQRPISVHEFLYPLAQGYDSVALKSDVELGGSDQRFNLIVGRELQKTYGQEPQVIMTMPLLEGTDGVQKMSKSYDNYIALEDTPREMFGKTMRISDELMIRYYELLTDLSVAGIESLKANLKSGSLHPREAKANLAKALVDRFYGTGSGDRASKEFDEIFVNKGLPSEIAVQEISSREALWICHLLQETGLCASTSEARRSIQGRAVEWDGVKVVDEQLRLALVAGEEHLIKVGKKKFLKLKVR